MASGIDRRVQFAASRQQAAEARDKLNYMWVGSPPPVRGWVDEPDQDALAQLVVALGEVAEQIRTVVVPAVQGFVQSIQVMVAGQWRTTYSVRSLNPTAVSLSDDGQTLTISSGAQDRGRWAVVSDALRDDEHTTFVSSPESPNYGLLGSMSYRPYAPDDWWPDAHVVTWPDKGYPCQVCWSVGRWPWEPERCCPVEVDVESTYCKRHADATW